MAWAAEEVTIDAVNFPDEIFREYVASKFDKDNNGKLSEKEITETTFIDIDNKGISSLKGVEYFTALTRLYFEDNQLTKLDVSKNTMLTSLSCLENQLTSLDVSRNTALEWLQCSSNQLTSLDISQNTALTELCCYDNPGDGESLFPVTAWFDNNNIPGNMQFKFYSWEETDGKTWNYDGKTIRIDFRKAE